MVTYSLIGCIIGCLVTILYFHVRYPTIGEWMIDEFNADKDIFKIYFTRDPSILFNKKYAVFEVTREKNTDHND